MRKMIIVTGIIFLSVLVLVFSWVPSPLLSLLGILPDQVGHWADASDHVNSRTAVPMVLWGIFAGLWIILYKNEGLKSWIIAWLIGIVLISIAEFGQFFMPERFPDFGDIGWGIFGTSLGLFGAYLLFVSGKYVFLFLFATKKSANQNI